MIGSFRKSALKLMAARPGPMLAPSVVIVKLVSLPGSKVVRGKVTFWPLIVPCASPATAMGLILSLKVTVTVPLTGSKSP